MYTDGTNLLDSKMEHHRSPRRLTVQVDWYIPSRDIVLPFFDKCFLCFRNGSSVDILHGCITSTTDFDSISILPLLLPKDSTSTPSQRAESQVVYKEEKVRVSFLFED